MRERFLRKIRDQAIAQWGREMWNEQHSVWAAARQAGDDLLAPWQHLLQEVRRPRPADEVARTLINQAERGGLRTSPDARTIIAVSLARSRAPGIGQHQVAAVRDALQDAGFAGLVTLPNLPELHTLPWGQTSQLLLRPAGAAAAAANRLAHTITQQLNRRR